MKVETVSRDPKTGEITKKVVDTQKMSARQRKCVELVENSMLRQWAHENKGACFVWAGGEPYDGKVGWITYYTRDSHALITLVNAVGRLVSELTKGQLKVQLVSTVP